MPYLFLCRNVEGEPASSSHGVLLNLDMLLSAQEPTNDIMNHEQRHYGGIKETPARYIYASKHNIS